MDPDWSVEHPTRRFTRRIMTVVLAFALGYVLGRRSAGAGADKAATADGAVPSAPIDVPSPIVPPRAAPS